ncbi:MAG: DUF5906 domain-containing protein [Ignavibacteria bacterium]|nr:DUF5906 domain-containing protein [Ignavibacteria bacterium]
MINAPLTILTYFNQFILYRPSPKNDGSIDKFPVDYHTGRIANVNDPAIWLSYANAEKMARMTGLKIGFVFTKNDPFFFLDIDGCREGNKWSITANELCRQFPKTAIEVSYSGNGLHIIGMYKNIPPHGCKNEELGLEFYHEKRFMALGSNAVGLIGDCTDILPAILDKYFKASDSLVSGVPTWTTEPTKEWSGPIDDAELLKIALRAKSGSSVFGKKATFKDLYEANEEILAVTYPDKKGTRQYDSSSVDMAAIQYLMFYTGKNCERTLRIIKTFDTLRAAGLKNRGWDKWERADYLPRTITRAFELQQCVYSVGKIEEFQDNIKYPPLRGSQKQKEYAEKIRSAKLEKASEEQLSILVREKSAPFWIETADNSIDEMVEKLKPNPMNSAVTEAIQITGRQYMTAEKQLEYFKDCVYVSDRHEIFTPTGEMGQFLGPEAFAATYNGYEFQIDDLGGNDTKNAWEAFTKSRCIKFPKARYSGFRPDLPPGTISEYKKSSLLNTYIPYDYPRVLGDPSPFLDLIKKLLPNERDQQILLSYLAALVQYRGKKFRWAPLIQGTPGNGKTTISTIMKKIIGDHYTHVPRTKDLKDDFNAWIENKLLVAVEDVYSPVDNSRDMMELLKPMITNPDLSLRGMHQLQRTAPNYANFIFNTNNKNALAKDKNDRRYAIFYTKQQSAKERDADGLTGAYFSKLYDWIDSGGTSIVNDFLLSYKIPDELNPATQCQIAPVTSSTDEAIRDGLSSAQQEVVEAIESEEQGFCEGFISSAALESLCKEKVLLSKMSINRRIELLKSLDYIKHPALKDGRATSFMLHGTERGKRPVIWVKNNHPSLMIAEGKEVTEMYMRAQRYVENH